MPRAAQVIALAIAAQALACARADQPTPAPTEPTVVSVRATDYAFEMPDTIPAGMTMFRLANAGATFHHLLLVRIDSGKSYTDAVAALSQPGPPAGWLTFIGGPAAPDPSGEANATFAVGAGNYVAVCFVDVPGGVPHIAHGMIRQLTVAPSEASAPPPANVTARVTLMDYGFVLADSLTAGLHTFEVSLNPGQPHELELLRLEPGKTLADLQAWMQSMNGPPPASAVGGVIMGQPGTPMYFSADITPATYVLICFLPDSKDGKPHVEHGMIQTIVVG